MFHKKIEADIAEIQKDLKVYKVTADLNSESIIDIYETLDEEDVDPVPEGIILSRLDLPWHSKGDVVVSILNDSGMTVAVEVPLEYADAIISILNSFVEGE